MSFIPVFEIGVWNAWIFMIYQFVLLGLGALIYSGSFKKGATGFPYDKREKIVDIVYESIFYIGVIYSVFLPLKLGTIWFYIGLPIFLLGAIMNTVASVNFATAPLAELVSKGIYRYSRHPIYVSFLLMFIGAGVATASWLLLLFAVVLTILMNPLVIPEERFCLDKYGDSYRKYMNRTPRWIGMPKS